MGKTTVTASIYNAVKTLIKGGAGAAEVAEYMNISNATFYRIKASQDYEDYKHSVQMTALAMKKKEAKEEEKKPEPEQPKQIVHSVTVQATHYMMQELQKTNELLTLISNKLAFIVEQLN